ncbi:MAG TPA: response regulator [Gemmatimonadaceae bacterium]|nr:response regulator [Gemmatimonadaceae bacterium]
MRRIPGVTGIRSKLLVAFSSLVASIAVFIFLFFPARLERQAMRLTVTKAAAIRDMTGNSVAAGLLFNDKTAIDEVLAGVSRVQDVAFVVVWNTSGRVVGETGAVQMGSPPSSANGAVSNDQRMYVTSAPVFSGQDRVGSVSVGISLAVLRADVADSRRVGALVGILFGVTGLLLVYAISTLVTRPLTAVAATVDRIAAGDLTLRATETADKEVARLVRAFNRMVDTLVGAQGELAEMNEKLEARVVRRTAELTDSIEQERISQVALIESEIEARRTSQLLQSLINVAPQAIVAVDLDWNVTRWNAAAEQLFGWTATEVLGHPLPYIPDDDRSAFEGLKSSIVAGKATGPIEVRRTRKGGTSVSVLFSAGSLRDPEQNIVGYIAFLTDMTERKRLEEQLRQAQKMEAVGQLAGGVAHDFNNILTVITAYTGLLLLEERNPERRSHLEQVAGASTRAAALTRQLLTFTRQQVVQVRPVELNSVVRELEPMLRRVLRANIQLDAVLDDSAGIVLADRTQLEQVLMNLVVNASDAMPEGGSLVIETRGVDVAGRATGIHPNLPKGRYANLVVRDTGSGMDEATSRRIFEPFFTTKEVGKGTGLGLATTYTIVTGLGGDIVVMSEVGLGTTFDISIPQSLQGASESSLVPREGNAVPRASGTILVVEDETAVRTVVRRSLERAGYDVLEAATGEAGLAIAAQRSGDIDAVVTDMMMPGMNGRVFAAELAKRFPDLGVIFVSGYIDSSIGDTVVADDKHVFVQKPFAADELLAAIATVSRKREPMLLISTAAA